MEKVKELFLFLLFFFGPEGVDPPRETSSGKKLSLLQIYTYIFSPIGICCLTAAAAAAATSDVVDSTIQRKIQKRAELVVGIRKND